MRKVVDITRKRRHIRHEAELFESLATAEGPPPLRLRRLLDAITGMFGEWVKAGPLLVDFLREPRGHRQVRKTFRAARAVQEMLAAALRPEGTS